MLLSNSTFTGSAILSREGGSSGNRPRWPLLDPMRAGELLPVGQQDRLGVVRPEGHELGMNREQARNVVRISKMHFGGVLGRPWAANRVQRALPVKAIVRIDVRCGCARTYLAES